MRAMDFPPPLAGVRVIDVTTSLAGPYCTEMLGSARRGRGQGRAARQPATRHASWGPPFWNGESTMFLAVNAGKRSLALDLVGAAARSCCGSPTAPTSSSRACGRALPTHAASGRTTCARATRGSSTRPSARSVARGRWRARPGYDPLMQAAGGIISVTGEAGRPGRARRRLDRSTRAPASGRRSASSRRCIERERTGEGGRSTSRCYETALALLSYQLTGYLGSGDVPGRHGTAFPSIAPVPASSRPPTGR